MERRTVLKALAAAGVAAVGLTACGNSDNAQSASSTAAAEEKVDKTLTGFYVSNQNVDFRSMYPTYTFKIATFGLQTVETYADGSYCLTQSTSSFSGGLVFSDDGSHDEVPRGSTTYRYTGTYTSAEESGLLTLTLSAPTAVATVDTLSTGSTGCGYVNTEAWTEAMGDRVGGENGTMSAEDYLASVTYPELTLIVDQETASFDYTPLSES